LFQSKVAISQQLLKMCCLCTCVVSWSVDVVDSRVSETMLDCDITQWGTASGLCTLTSLLHDPPQSYRIVILRTLNNTQSYVHIYFHNNYVRNSKHVIDMLSYSRRGLSLSCWATLNVLALQHWKNPLSGNKLMIFRVRKFFKVRQLHLAYLSNKCTKSYCNWQIVVQLTVKDVWDTVYVCVPLDTADMTPCKPQ